MNLKLNILLATLIFTTFTQAQEVNERYVLTCMARDTNNKPTRQKMTECITLIKKLNAEKGSQYVVDNYSFVWSSKKEKDILAKIAASASFEMGYKEPNNQAMEQGLKKIVELSNKDDWQTLNCLYLSQIGKTRCLK
ncbi:hypothetical protein [Campylobacter sp. MIT 97-5078]|uniref:hypothetical protein n=1 Tax=Campylobacter sp. MIT 97-5078 TaxID=1548153 RepID=UPI000512E653|nr:hypothetical protein [Campylobacter sp. MIT 97-5078]KGI56047.1 hypothetical protein LR59_09210 [Campylobacter sp. MIT 97-5078]KGI57477.1 hypothetical protein LR59_01900 [Campylobacter sp. MIT 97-5078]KGI57494.1 hypothetical protein LR59_01995 [Campylobacter sp. MIT 97-5078]TQR27406.1 hypothetical protein DMB91_03880 [Campylobacter sp. MIT 97-5078]